MKYKVQYKLEFSGWFDFDDSDLDDDRNPQTEAFDYLYDCWYNMIDRPDSIEITAFVEK